MFYDSVVANTYYMFAARTVPFEGSSVETPGDSLNDTYLELNERMIFGKHITSNDIRYMIERREWETGTVYPIYDHEDDDLASKRFYVVTLDGDEYSVFKCIDNDNDSVSLVKPIRSETSPGDDFYRTSDNYVWKLMYTVPESSFEKFATSKYFPLEVDTQIANNAIAGGIECVRVENAGSGYRNFVEGTVSQINISGNPRKFYVQSDTDTLATATNYYTNSAIYITSGSAQGQLRSITEYGIENNRKYVIVDSSFSPAISAGDGFEISPNIIVTGDGTGFQGRGIVNETSGSIERVEIINRGTGYTQGVGTVVANTASFDANTFNASTVRPIISPIGGHGSNQQKELFARNVGISVDFIGDDFPTANNDFRTFGILKDPSFRRAELTLDSVNELSSGDIIIQANTGAQGTISSIDVGNTSILLSNTQGVFNTTDILDVANTSNAYSISTIDYNNDTFDQRLTLNVTMTFLSGFQRDERVVQQNTNASGIVHEYAAGVLKLTDVQGNFAVSTTSVIVGQTSSARAVINSITQPDMIKGTGEAMYIQNIEPIIRADDRTERTKIIIGF